MSKQRKPRSDSKLKNLPQDVQDRIASWCQEDGLQSACSRCASELQPPISTTMKALSLFMQWRAVQDRKETLTELFARADANAKAVEDLLRKDFPGATAETLAAAGQMVFTLQASQAKDSKEFRELEYLRVSKETLAAN